MPRVKLTHRRVKRSDGYTITTVPVTSGSSVRAWFVRDPGSHAVGKFTTRKAATDAISKHKLMRRSALAGR